MQTNTLPRTAQDWQLYCSKKGAEEAAQALTEALGELLREVGVRKAEGYVPTSQTVMALIHRHLHPVMDQYEALGASDTEPRTVAYRTIKQAIGLKDTW